MAPRFKVCILAALLLLIPVISVAQDSYDTYGKTEAEILAMGHEKWNTFYESKAGDSTAAMGEQNEIFGEVATRRNDRLLKKAKAQTKKRVAKLRNLMGDFAGTACELGSNMTGGGTLWNPIEADIPAGVEQVVFGVLGGKAGAAKPIRVSAAQWEMATLAKQIEKNRTDPEAQAYFKYNEAKAQLKKMKAALTNILEIARSLNRYDSDRILGFCKDYAKLAIGDWS
jgi:hypothetical protein